MQVIADAVARILTLAADQLDQRATFTHPVGGYETPRCVAMGTVRAAITSASDDLLRANRLVGCSRIDAARIKVYLMLPPVTGTVAEYAAQLRALAA
jgi:hypothetical protein